MNDLFPYLEVPCKYCKEISLMKDYHHSYHITKQAYYLTCPKCEERMIMDISVKKKEEDKG